MPLLMPAAGGWDVEGLPTLIGSDKQVAWATRLRGRRIHNELHFMIGAFCKIMEAGGRDRADYWPKLAATLEAVFAHDQAKWWIDRRGDSIHWLIGWRDRTEAAERIFRFAMSDR